MLCKREKENQSICVVKAVHSMKLLEDACRLRIPPINCTQLKQMTHVNETRKRRNEMKYMKICIMYTGNIDEEIKK